MFSFEFGKRIVSDFFSNLNRSVVYYHSRTQPFYSGVIIFSSQYYPVLIMFRIINNQNGISY